MGKLLEIEIALACADPMLVRMECLDKLTVDQRLEWIQQVQATLRDALLAPSAFDASYPYRGFARQADAELIELRLKWMNRLLVRVLEEKAEAEGSVQEHNRKVAAAR